MEEFKGVEGRRGGGVDSSFKFLVAEMGLSRLGVSAFDLMIIWILLHFTGSPPVLAGWGDGMLSLPLMASFFVGGGGG